MYINNVVSCIIIGIHNYIIMNKGIYIYIVIYSCIVIYSYNIKQNSFAS